MSEGNGNPGYALIATFNPGTTKASILGNNGKIIVFDTPNIARNVVPVLGNDREFYWTDEDNIFWLPIQPNCFSRAMILTQYDPYHVPANVGLLSETKYKEWRYHIMWHYIFNDVGQFVKRADGTMANLACGETVNVG